jgi:hypothetical protein
MGLTVNRYGVVSPTAIQSTGIAVSTPIYISLPVEQRKQVLNQIRTLKAKQLMELGWSEKDQEGGYKWSDDKSFQAPPLSPVEEELGCTEEHLRSVLFGRNGIPERLLVKIQRLTGIRLIERKQIESTYRDWLDHLFDS